MREIKFRAWQIKNKEYTDSIKVWLNQDLNAWAKECGLILEQFTGLYDCNYKDIYEGDILQGTEPQYGEFYAPVIYANCRFTIDSFRAVQVNNPEGWEHKHSGVRTRGFVVHWNPKGYHTIETGFKNNIFEIIGNIHENGNLLNG